MLVILISNWNILVILNVKTKSTSRHHIKTSSRIVSLNRPSINHISLRRLISMRKSEVERLYHHLLRKGRLCSGRIMVSIRSTTPCTWTIIFQLKSFRRMIMYLRLNTEIREWMFSIIRSPINSIWRISQLYR